MSVSGYRIRVPEVGGQDWELLVRIRVSEPPFNNEINSGRPRRPIPLVDHSGAVGLVYDLCVDSCAESWDN